MLPFLTSPRCCILTSFTIYLAAGREIFAKRQQLRAFSNPSRPALIEVENPFTSFKKTEIYVTTELATMTSPNIRDVFFPIDESEKSKGLPSRRPSNGGYDQYSVTIGSAPPMSPSFQAPPTPPKGLVTVQLRNNNNNNKAANDANAAAFGYTKVALLFFVSLLVTWVCISYYPVNRSFIHVADSRYPGSLIHKPRLQSRPPRPRLPPLHLRLRHRPPTHGLLEQRHLHHNIMASSARPILDLQLRGEEIIPCFQQETKCWNKKVDGE